MQETIVIVNYRAAPGEADTAAREIDALVRQVLSTEPDCGGIELLRDAADPARFMPVERWPSREVFLRSAQAAAPHPVLHPACRRLHGRTAGDLVLVGA